MSIRLTTPTNNPTNVASKNISLSAWDEYPFTTLKNKISAAMAAGPKKPNA